MEAIVLGLILLLVALLLSLFFMAPLKMEGFQVGAEPGTTVANCSALTNCKSCAGAKNCGWCSNIEKCVEVNRFGEPILNACPTSRYVRLPEQCVTAPPTTMTATGTTTTGTTVIAPTGAYTIANAGSPTSAAATGTATTTSAAATTGPTATTSTGTAATAPTGSIVAIPGTSPTDTTSTVVLPTYELRPCTSTDQVIEAAKKRLSDTVKALVRNEMRLYNVPLTEGFSVEDDISKVVVYSIQDDVKNMVKDSVEKARTTKSQ